MPSFSIVAETDEETVVTKYTPQPRNSNDFQTEAELEAEFIRMLCEQGYEYIKIRKEEDLIANLRRQLEALNDYTFTDDEWSRFFTECIASPSDTLEDRTHRIQEDHIQVLKRDNGMSKNITLIDKLNIHSNRLQVINQYRVQTENVSNRYDVTVLVNGFPMVHIELKSRGSLLRKAFDQIERYSRDSFGAGYGLFEYLQIFVISNGTETKYYSNTTRIRAGNDNAAQKYVHDKASSSFEFTSYWADAGNKIIPDLVDFTRTFFARHTLLNVIIKYCVFTSEKTLMVMRPYQITAAESIINHILMANNYKKYGDIAGGGYIWHTTGSGKTLTSFKTARIASKLPFIDKVLFVVDRKDLDYQTMREYDHFKEGAAKSSKSSAALQQHLEASDKKIIITTIQKLSAFIKKNKTHPIYSRHVVIIFDECHRSQFGGMHREIVRHFRKYYIFGFTGTPIFFENEDGFTTQKVFGEELHAYTIADAIRDKNVLPFKVDFISTMRRKADIFDELLEDIDRENAYNAQERISLVVQYILENFDRKTYRRQEDEFYTLRTLANVSEVARDKYSGKVSEKKEESTRKGFNSILAVSSITAAMMYYEEFRKAGKLKAGVIYSHAPEKQEADGIIDDENPEDTAGMTKEQREFLDGAIQDYNAIFSTNYDTSSEKFQNYYRDVSLRMKNGELDLLIVVNMFLTGFDAPALNTLWVDKSLKLHGLMQAFSRTNRVLNSIKTFGNIVCFRNLRRRVDETIAMFGHDEAGRMAVIRKFADYYVGYESEEGVKVQGYADMVRELTEKFPLTEPQIVGDQAKREFVGLFGAVLRMRNLLTAFDEFRGKEILSERDIQDYQSRYLDIRDEWLERKEKGESADINDDLVFELELISQVEINIDYIMILAEKYRDSHCTDKEILITIRRAVDSSPELRSKKQLIDTFLEGIHDVVDIISAWREHTARQREKDLAALIKEEDLKPEALMNYIADMFKHGAVKTTGEEITKFMPPISVFDPSREQKKRNIIKKLYTFFNKYRGV